MERLFQDIRFALRLLFKDRAFTITTLLTLALCIGANAAIFAVVNSVLLRPLPVPEPDRLVLLYNSYPKAGVERASTGVPDYYDRLRETDAFEELALYKQRGITVGGDGRRRAVDGHGRRALAVPHAARQPVHGAHLHRGGSGAGQPTARSILSYALWQRLFGGRDRRRRRGPAHQRRRPTRIVGVMPAGFHFMAADVDALDAAVLHRRARSPTMRGTATTGRWSAG